MAVRNAHEQEILSLNMQKYRMLAVPDFLQKEAPANYIAGLGRGATGFTTRSDLGPAEDFIDTGGEDAPLFTSTLYEADDEEADRIWKQVEEKMDERRRARREKREKEELAQLRKEKPKIQEQFADLKRNLSELSEQDWAAIPEVGDLTRKKGRKENKLESFSAVPDSILTSSIEKTSSSINPESENLGLTQFGEARNRVLGIKLDQKSDSVSGQTNIDPKGYLTEMSSVVVKSDAEIGDIKKARTLLKSVISSNPKHAPGWIAAARLEEVANKMAAARDLIARGCEACPRNEDVWLEAARLNSIDNAKIILANAVREIPLSVKIWLKAKDLETDPKLQKRVLRRALEYIPNSVTLWKAAVSCEEDSEDARILLSRAVECVPLSIELWLALARLETYENAKKVLNKARTTIPTSHEIWVAAAKLEEQYGEKSRVQMIVNRAIQQLEQRGSNLGRDVWLKEAEAAETERFTEVCGAIIQASIELGLDEADKEETLLEDAENFIATNHFESARAVYKHLVNLYPENENIWKTGAFFEKQHGTKDVLYSWLEKAVLHCPRAEVLWLIAAKEKWLENDVVSARSILQKAFDSNPNSEQIWLAAIKLETETGNIDKARKVLEEARQKVDSPRIWMKSVVLERQEKNLELAKRYLEEALSKYPSFPKLWIIKAQVLMQENDIAHARSTLSEALKLFPKNSVLWILASRLEEQGNSAIKARATLEKARIQNIDQEDIWLEAIAVENRAGNAAMAKVLLAKGLQSIPNSGKLWSHAILTESKPQRKARSADALKKCENNPWVVLAIARLFWSERKIDKARNWFQRAVKTNPDIGDSWSWWLKFEIAHGTLEQREEVMQRFKEAEPKHGDSWQSIVKNIANSRKKPEELLKLLASKLENQI